MSLTQKETELLKDLKGQEKLCIDKYSKHAQAAKDTQLKNLFDRIAQTEREHLQTLHDIEQGKAPVGTCAIPSQQPTFSAAYGIAENEDKKNDCFLCSDLLTMEKHASHLYDTCIFEFKQAADRQALNHIQKEEQEHGKMIYDYMKANSMYS